MKLEISAGVDPPTAGNRFLLAVGDALNHHRRGSPVGDQPRRVDFQHAAVCGKVQLVVPALPGGWQGPGGKVAAASHPVGQAEPLWLDGALAPLGDGVEVRPRNPQQPVVAGEPEEAIVILENPAQVESRHAFGRGVRRQPGSGDPVQTGSRHGPYASVAIAEHAEHHVPRRRGAGQRGTELSVIEPLHTARRSYPEGSVNSLGNSCYRHAGQALRFAQDRHRVALKTDEAVRRSSPHRAIALLKQQTDGALKLPLALCRALRFPAEPSQDALFGSGPNVALAVADNRPHQTARRPVLRAVNRHVSGGAETGDAVGRAQPDISRGILLDRPDRVARQPFPHGAHGHAILFEAVDAAAGGAHPHAPLGVFEQAANGLVRQPVARLVGTEPVLVVAPDAAAVGAHPQRAIAVRKQRHDDGWRKSVAPAVGSEAPLAILRHPAGMRAHPQRTAARRRQTPDRVVRQPVFGGEYPFHSVLEPVQPVIGAHPDSPRGVLQQDVHVGFKSAREEGAAPAVIQPRQASIGPDPQHTPRIHPQRPEIAGGQAQVAGNPFKAAIAVAQQPVIHRSDPQRSIRRRRQRGDGALFQERSIRAVKYREVHAVEAGQSAGGCKPHVPVGGLCDGADRVLRQSVRRGPDVVAELSESQLGIQPPGGNRYQGHQQRVGRTPRHNSHIGWFARASRKLRGDCASTGLRWLAPGRRMRERTPGGLPDGPLWTGACTWPSNAANGRRAGCRSPAPGQWPAFGWLRRETPISHAPTARRIRRQPN